MSFLGGIVPLLLTTNRDATISIKDIETNISSYNGHLSKPTLITLSSTIDHYEGSLLSLEYISNVKEIAKKNNMRMHLDAQKGLNAAVALNKTPAEMVKDFDTVNFCLR
jgi:threonine aldolase